MTTTKSQYSSAHATPPFRRNLANHKHVYGFVFFLSGLVNALALSAPLFALQVYDRVLNSRSEETLLVLVAILAIALAGMSALDHFRRRLLANLGASLAADLTRSAIAGQKTSGRSIRQTGQLDQLHGAMAAPAMAALFDVPWLPLFAGGLFLFHPVMGWWVLSAGAVYVICIALGWRRANTGVAATVRSWPKHAPNPRPVFWTTCAAGQTQTRLAAQKSADLVARRAAFVALFRTLVQSLTIALAALLVLRGQMTPGAILASTVLLAKFLGPFEHINAGVGTLRSGWHAARQLWDLPPKNDERTTRTAYSPLDVKELSTTRFGGGQFALRNISFHVPAGKVMGVIGPNGAGKSRLLAALAQDQSPPLGTIIPAFDPETSLHIPQVLNLDGQTISEVISGGHPAPDTARLWAALAEAGLDGAVRTFPDGLEQVIGPDGPFSAGGARMLVFARLSYQSPRLVLLDDPFAGLDASSLRRAHAIVGRAAENGSVIIVASNSPSNLTKADLILALDRGRQVAFGPAAEVLVQTTQNVARIGPTSIGRMRV